MTANDQTILLDFQTESKALIKKMTLILEKCECGISQVQRLEEYGQAADRIMGAAKSVSSTLAKPMRVLGALGDYAALCKAVGYKGSQINGNETFYDICVAFLQDATEVLGILVDDLLSPDSKNFRSYFNEAFIDRLRWVSDQFTINLRETAGSVATSSTKMNQAEIDELMKKLGLG